MIEFTLCLIASCFIVSMVLLALLYRKMRKVIEWDNVLKDGDDDINFA